MESAAQTHSSSSVRNINVTKAPAFKNYMKQFPDDYCDVADERVMQPNTYASHSQLPAHQEPDAYIFSTKMNVNSPLADSNKMKLRFLLDAKPAGDSERKTLPKHNYNNMMDKPLENNELSSSEDQKELIMRLLYGGKNKNVKEKPQKPKGNVKKLKIKLENSTDRQPLADSSMRTLNHQVLSPPATISTLKSPQGFASPQSAGSTSHGLRILLGSNFTSSHASLQHKPRQLFKNPSSKQPLGLSINLNDNSQVPKEKPDEIINFSLSNFKFDYNKLSPKEAKDLIKKLLEKGEVIENKRKELAAEKVQQEMKECTFQPQTGARTSLQPRSLDDFMRDQRLFVEKKESNKKLILDKKILEETHELDDRPHINEKSREMASRKKSLEKEVHQRLYKHKPRFFDRDTSMPQLNASNFFEPPRSKTPNAASKDAQYLFKPAIQTRSKNLNRNEKIVDILYKDAQRRLNKSLEQKRKSSQPKKNTYMIDHSQKILTLKIIKEFEQESDNLFPSHKEHRFTYMQMCEFMKTLKFVKNNENIHSAQFAQERTLLYKMWSILKGDQYQGINERNLLVFILAICGIGYPIPPYVKPESKTPNSRERRDYCDSVVQKLRRDEASDDEEIVEIRTPEMRSQEIQAGTTESGTNIFNVSEVRSSGTKKNNNYIQLINSASTNFTSKNLGFNFDSGSTATQDLFKSAKFPQLKLASNGASGIADSHKCSMEISNESSQNAEQASKDEAHNRGHLNFGIFDDKENIYFSREDIHFLEKTYYPFYCHKLSSQKPEKKPQEKVKAPTVNNPEMLNKTKNLAEHHRLRQIEKASKYFIESHTPPPNNGQLSHAELLIYERKAEDLKKKTIKEIISHRELNECTFKPKTNDYKNNSKVAASHYLNEVLHNSVNIIYPDSERDAIVKDDKRSHTPVEKIGRRRNEELYNLTKNSAKRKSDKSTVEYEFERNQSECTFIPKLMGTNMISSLSKKNLNDTSRDFDKSVERLTKGRELREAVAKKKEIRTNVNNSGMNFHLEKASNKSGFEQFQKKQAKAAEKSRLEKRMNVPALGINLAMNRDEKNAGMHRYNSSPSPFSISKDERDESKENPSHLQSTNENFNMDRKPSLTTIKNKINVYRDERKLSNDNRRASACSREEPSNQSHEGSQSNSDSDRKKSKDSKYSPDTSVDNRVPILHVDVNFGSGRSQRIIVFEGDTCESLAEKFAQEHGLTDQLKTKLKLFLGTQMSSILTKIDEENPSISETDTLSSPLSKYKQLRNY